MHPFLGIALEGKEGYSRAVEIGWIAVVILT